LIKEKTKRKEIRMSETNNKVPTGIVYDSRYLNHVTGNHPENPTRISTIYNHLEKTGIVKDVIHIKPYSAPLEIIEYNHSKEYIESVRSLSERGGGMLDMDTVVSPRTYETALLAVGGVLSVIDSIMENTIKNGLCLIRPPGHHALRERGMGFCIFNNIAIGALYIQKNHNLKKVAIIDWDVHHGNGTQASFYEDPTVFYLSIHQFPHYPGTGSSHEIGLNEGKGYTLNCPVGSGAGISEYRDVFENRFIPAIKKFKPDFILLSCGFDAHTDDPLASINLQTEDYRLLTNIVTACSREVCKGRIVSLLEGGYDLNALKSSTYEHLSALMEFGKSE
jgi:acetoin utilization deacetylase AcuC-like enzyme